jgi:hypothetical protein
LAEVPVSAQLSAVGVSVLTLVQGAVSVAAALAAAGKVSAYLFALDMKMPKPLSPKLS